MNKRKNQNDKTRGLKNLHVLILLTVLGFILYGNTCFVHWVTQK